MFSKFSFWIWATIMTQLLSGAFHSISFFVNPEPANDSEKQLTDLMNNYKMDMGAGISRTLSEIFLSLSICFTVICVFAGIINWYMQKKNVASDLWKGLLLIEAVTFGALFLVMLRFTFLPPIICTGAIFLFIIGALFTNKTSRV